MLDIEKIRQLVDMMVANDLSEVSLRDGEEEINLRRARAEDNGLPTSVPARAAAAPGPPPADPPMPEAAPPAAPEASDVELLEIRSPMVGTFYSAADPESPPYVQVGSHVHPHTVVCIVEAMKVFNEIKAEVTGTVERILVANEQTVEYGQPMFLVRPH